MSVIRPLDIEGLARGFSTAKPFPFVMIDAFLDPGFAREVADSYPDYEQAAEVGQAFESVNEHMKIQVMDQSVFPEPVQRLHRALSAPEFLAQLSSITGISELLADERLAGGGMHQTGPRGRLDVHIDFNRLDTSGWHRRLNILVYLNPTWKREWGGNLELWDEQVKVCHQSLAPILNRCVIFETSERSFHGVEPVTCPSNLTRKSFAGYYYTVDAPANWNGNTHSTIFRARPTERMKGLVLMPMMQVREYWRRTYLRVKLAAKQALGR